MQRLPKDEWDYVKSKESKQQPNCALQVEWLATYVSPD